MSDKLGGYSKNITNLFILSLAIHRMEDLLMLPNRHLARRVIAMYLRTNELSNAVQLAKESMKSVREDKIKSVRAEKASAQKSLADQKRHFENIVVRHQTFVEQLLKDKSSLCEKVTALSRRVESQNQAWEHKLEAEVNRTRDSVLASEKIRRERWTKEHTKKIKELTVKGLEHEINQMMEKHKQEISDLKRQHQEDMHQRIDEARSKFESMEKGIRETCAEDREAVIEKERNAIRERYERQLITEQHGFEEQKVRMALEWNSERERLNSEIKAKEREFEGRKESILSERNNQIDQLRAEQKEKIREITEQHRNDAKSMRDQLEKDFAIWKGEFESAQKLREIEKENAIRTECRRERDAQIDSIVAKIDSEAQRHQQEYDLKMRRMRDKFEIDLKELEVAESKCREKYLETRHRLAECDGSRQNMQTTIKQLEIELGHSKKLCNEFMLEKDTIYERAREEIRSEMESKRREHEEEIQNIYSRVQKAIQKKDATLEVLQGDNNILKERCLKLEQIIRQQRKDYCTK